MGKYIAWYDTLENPIIPVDSGVSYRITRSSFKYMNFLLERSNNNGETWEKIPIKLAFRSLIDPRNWFLWPPDYIEIIEENDTERNIYFSDNFRYLDPINEDLSGYKMQARFNFRAQNWSIRRIPVNEVPWHLK